MSISTYHMEIGDEVPCMKCGKKIVLDYEPEKCCASRLDSVMNYCGCGGAPEPVLCDNCWKEINK